MKKHTSLAPLPIDQWDASLQAISTDMQDQPLNVHSLMANNPALLAAWWNFRNYCVTGASLGKRNGELVILRVSLHMRSWYEWASHVERALACGLTLEEIEQVKKNPESSLWRNSEKLLFKAVDDLVAHHSISSDIHLQLCKHYNAKQIMDIISIYGMYNILGCMINTWDLELDSHIEKKLPTNITREAFEKK